MYCINLRSVVVAFFLLCTSVLFLSINPVQSQQVSGSPNQLVPDTEVSNVDKTPVFILGTTHLSNVKDKFRAESLDSLIQVLSGYNPKIIAIERPRDKHYAKTRTGTLTQELKNISFDRARHVSDSLLHLARINPDLAPETRLMLVEHLAAAHRIPSASLQWSYLPESYRNRPSSIPDTVASVLEASLDRSNEIYSIGVRLARKLGRQQLYPVDGHSEDDMIRTILPQLKEGLTPSLQDSIGNSPHFKKSRKLLMEGIESGNLMPLYRYMNSPEYLNPDVEKQWQLFLNTPMPEKAGRARLAFWEMRNLTMATNIQRASGQHPTEPVLFIVGASHKAFLDTYLDQMMGVDIVQLDDLLET